MGSKGGPPAVRHDGITLSSVVPGGSADQAGLRAGDVILSINDHYLYTSQEMSQELRLHSAGTKITIRYLRYGIIYETPLVLGSER